MDKIIQTEIFYIFPWNLLKVFHLIKKDEMYILKSDLGLITGDIIYEDSSKEECLKYIEDKKKYYEEKWFKLLNSPEKQNKKDISSFLHKIYEKEVLEEKLNTFTTEEFKYFYYIENTEEFDNNHYYVFNQFDEYIWHFTITYIEWVYQFWWIFISENFQRKWLLTTIIQKDLFNIFSNRFWLEELEWVYIPSILESSRWFYDKLEEEWNFEYFRNRKGWYLYL